MSLIKWTPFMEPFSDMDKFLDEFGMDSKSNFMPAIDIYEKGNNLIAEMPVSGIDPDKVDVEITNNVLTVKGQTEKKSEVEEKNYFRKEVKTGSFYRSVALPTAVNGDQASAEYANGILKITVPKVKEEKSKKIVVKTKRKD